MGFLISLCKVIALVSLILFSIGALFVGDLHRGMLEPVVPDAMFNAPAYQPPTTGPYPPRPKWDESKLIEKELALDEDIATLETKFYSLRYHQLEFDENGYKGGKNSAGEREGIGRVELPNGDIYMGEWKKNLRHGIGGLMYAGGDIYETEWAFGDPHGFGSHRMADGYHYIGEFIAGQPSGFGRALYGTKAYYLGQFREGKPHGWGNWTNGINRYEGDFVEGKRSGRGRLSEYATGKTLFEGQFTDDRPLRAGWQPKPKYQANPDTNTQEGLGTADQTDASVQEEQEVVVMPLSAGGIFK